jgi:Fe-S cluster assembly ATPase SufC
LYGYQLQPYRKLRHCHRSNSVAHGADATRAIRQGTRLAGAYMAARNVDGYVSGAGPPDQSEFHHQITTGRSIVIDDVGEGLDFERSMALIKLLIKKCKHKNLQLLMATNDRFVMNEVELRYWHVVHRTGNHVRILDYQNTKKRFDEFKFLGLSNFDFFSSEAYLGSDS